MGTVAPALPSPRLPAPVPSVAVDAGIEQRSMAALLRCVARHGMTKTTLDDVAREAGCARATLYRYFGGKRQLAERTVAAESERIQAVVEAAAAEAATLEDALVAVVTTAARALDRHEALQFLLAHELDVVLPFVTFDGGDRFLEEAGRALAPSFARFLPADRLEWAGEWVARTILVYAFRPDAPVRLADEAQARPFLRELVLPGLVPTTAVLIN